MLKDVIYIGISVIEVVGIIYVVKYIIGCDWFFVKYLDKIYVYGVLDVDSLLFFLGYIVVVFFLVILFFIIYFKWYVIVFLVVWVCGVGFVWMN